MHFGGIPYLKTITGWYMLIFRKSYKKHIEVIL